MENRPDSDEIDLHALFFKLRTRWPIFALALTLAVGGAYLYWQVKAPVYAFRSTMLLGNQSSGSKQAQELLQILDVREKGVKMEDEVGVLTSTEFVRQAVAGLPYAVSYFAQPNHWLNKLHPLQVRERVAGAVPFRVWVELKSPQLTGTIDRSPDSPPASGAGVGRRRGPLQPAHQRADTQPDRCEPGPDRHLGRHPAHGPAHGRAPARCGYELWPGRR